MPNFADYIVNRADKDFINQVSSFQRDPSEAKIAQWNLDKNNQSWKANSIKTTSYFRNLNTILKAIKRTSKKLKTIKSELVSPM